MLMRPAPPVGCADGGWNALLLASSIKASTADGEGWSPEALTKTSLAPMAPMVHRGATL